MVETTVRPGDKVLVSIPLWLMYQKGLASMELEGEVLAATEKAIKVKGWASVRRGERCRRCGQEINNPVSILVGYGPDCSAHLGIPRPEHLDPATLAQVIERVKVQTLWEGWLPLSQAKVEVIERAGVQAAPAPRRPAARINVVNGRIQVRCPVRYNDRLKAINGARWNATAKAWEYPASPTIAKALRAAFQNEFEADEAFMSLVQQAQAIEEAAQVKTMADDEVPPIPNIKTRPWVHQARAFWFAKDMPAVYLDMEMGTGKSLVAVSLIINKGCQSTIILAPRSVVNVWPREFRRHAGVPVEVLPLAEGSVAKKTEAARRFLDVAQAKGRPAVIVVNYEAAWREPFAKWALSRQWDAMILDEAHRIKAPGGRASRFAAELGKRAAFRVALSGTMLPHSPLDAYAQFRALDPGIFGTSLARFKARYAIMGGYGGYQIVGWRNMEEFRQKIANISFRVKKEEVLKLPEAIHIERTCRLSEKAAKVYRSMEEAFWADVDQGTVTASNALVRLLRLQQITSGFLPLDDTGEPVQVDTAKRDLLRDILTEEIPAGEPVVVFCLFQHDLDVVKALAEELGLRYGELSGRRNDLTPDATMPEDVDIMAVQIQAGGVGIDLTRASYAIYYSTGFRLGDYEQSLARLHRPGQQRTVRYIHLLAEGTVDFRAYWALRRRKDAVEAILDGRYEDPEGLAE